MKYFLDIALVVAMVAVFLVLVTGIFTAFKGGEFNRKYGNKLMQMRVALQAVAIIIFALVLMLR